MNTAAIATIGALDTRTTAGRLTTRRRLGLALLAAALASATACGSDSRNKAAEPRETTTAPATTSTTMMTSIASAPTTTVVAPTTTVTTVATVARPTVATVARPTATIDELVGADGARVHVRCVGQGDTTVLLVAGFEGSTESWAKVEPALATQARVCSSDRLGTGTSDPATSTATFTSQAADLHALLSTIGESGPYVVVGHSFGGAEAVTFASQYADEVIGLVLVDASPTTWPAAVCAVPDDGSEATAILRGLCTDTYPAAGNSEQLDVVTAFAEAAQIVSLGSPMAVITATHRELPPDLAESEVDRLNEAWNQGQQDWVALSTAAHLVTVDHTGHHIEIDQPGVVIDEITRLLP